MKTINGIMWAVLFVTLTACAGWSGAHAQEPTAQAQMTVNWAAPLAGGPVDDYALTCTGDFVVDVVTVAPTHTTTPINVTNGQQLSGSCSVAARNSVGTGVAVTANYLYNVAVSLPPGAPTDFTITFDCTMVDGVVTCEQV